MAYQESEKKREYNRAWCAAHKEYYRLRAIERYRSNPDAVKKASKKYAKENPEKISGRKKEWDLANRENRKKYLDANREKINTQAVARYKATAPRKREQTRDQRKKNPERHRESHARWIAKNKEHIAEYTKKRWAENREKISEASRKWHKENPEKVREYSQKRRADKIGSDGTVTAKEIRALWERQQGKCAYFSVCGNDLGERGIRGAHRDHIEPLIPKDPTREPGRHTISNIQLLCGSCNSRKRNNDPYAFTQRHEGRLFPDLPMVSKKR